MDIKEFLWQGAIPSAGAEPAIIAAGLVITIAFLWAIGKWAQVKPEE